MQYTSHVPRFIASALVTDLRAVLTYLHAYERTHSRFRSVEVEVEVEVEAEGEVRK